MGQGHPMTMMDEDGRLSEKIDLNRSKNKKAFKPRNKKTFAWPWRVGLPLRWSSLGHASPRFAPPPSQYKFSLSDRVWSERSPTALISFSDIQNEVQTPNPSLSSLRHILPWCVCPCGNGSIDPFLFTLQVPASCL